MHWNWVAVATAAVTPNLSSHWKHLKSKHLCYHYTTYTETAVIGWSNVLLITITYCGDEHFLWSLIFILILIPLVYWSTKIEFSECQVVSEFTHIELWLLRFMWWNHRYSEHGITPSFENPTAKIYIIAMWYFGNKIIFPVAW